MFNAGRDVVAKPFLHLCAERFLLSGITGFKVHGSPRGRPKPAWCLRECRAQLCPMGISGATALASDLGVAVVSHASCVNIPPQTRPRAVSSHSRQFNRGGSAVAADETDFQVGDTFSVDTWGVLLEQTSLDGGSMSWPA